MPRPPTSSDEEFCCEAESELFIHPHLGKTCRGAASRPHESLTVDYLRIMCKESRIEYSKAEKRHEEILSLLRLQGSVTSQSSQRSKSTSKDLLERAENLKTRLCQEGQNMRSLSPVSKFQFGTKDGSPLRKGSIRQQATFLIHQDYFEVVVTCLIMCNAIVMCVEVQYTGHQIGFELHYPGLEQSAAGEWPTAGLILSTFDWSFGTIFLLEAILKIFALRLRYFCVVWNWIDLISLLPFLIEKASIASSTPITEGKALKLIRLARLARLVRLIRTLEHLDVLYIMTTAIKGMTMIIVWSVSLLSLLLMACALSLSQYLQITYFGSTDGPAAQQMYSKFGTFSRCFLTMFEITLANWAPTARLLTEEISEWFSVICILHKLTIGLAVIGVINGVILQETFKVAHTDDMVMVRQKRRAKLAMKEKMEVLFEALDANQDGKIHFEEFMILAHQPDVKLWLESLDLEVDDLPTLFMLIDLDGDGSLTLDEILLRIPRLQGAARSIDVLAMRDCIPPTRLSESSTEEHIAKP